MIIQGSPDILTPPSGLNGLGAPQNIIATYDELNVFARGVYAQNLSNPQKAQIISDAMVSNGLGAEDLSVALGIDQATVNQFLSLAQGAVIDQAAQAQAEADAARAQAAQAQAAVAQSVAAQAAAVQAAAAQDAARMAAEAAQADRAVFSQAQITDAIVTSRNQGFSEAQIYEGLQRYLTAKEAEQALLTNPPPKTIDESGMYAARQAQLAIEAAAAIAAAALAQQRDAALALAASQAAAAVAATAAREKAALDALAVANALAAQRARDAAAAQTAATAKAASDAAAAALALKKQADAATAAAVAAENKQIGTTLTAAQITDAIKATRALGYSEADVLVGLKKYLPDNQAALAITANPPPSKPIVLATGATTSYLPIVIAAAAAYFLG
jgi:DNA-binding transcriptional regulator YhcF (GntR family)